MYWGDFVSIDKQIFLAGELWIFSFIAVRSFLNGVKELYLSKHEKKQRKKGQSFKEWFLYTRYRIEIPTIFLWLYFIVLIIHPLLFIFVCIAYFIFTLQTISWVAIIVTIVFDFLWNFIIWLLTWKPGERAMHYEYLIAKPKKKKKK